MFLSNAGSKDLRKGAVVSTSTRRGVTKVKAAASEGQSKLSTVVPPVPPKDTLDGREAKVSEAAIARNAREEIRENSLYALTIQRCFEGITPTSHFPRSIF